jgi:hypothetical protein
LEQLLSNSTTSFDTCIRFFFCCHRVMTGFPQLYVV